MRNRSPGWITKREGARGTVWYIRYVAPGTLTHKDAECPDVRNGTAKACPGHTIKRKKYCEAGGKTKTAAQALLDKRRRELADGKWTNPAKPLSFEDLLVLVEDDWRNNGRKSSLATANGKDQSNIAHLRKAFGGATVADITGVNLAAYSNRRQKEEGAAVSTVRNELNVLKHGMKLAHRQGQLSSVPAFPTLTPKTVRTGFFEREELDAILAELPAPVRALVLFMYWTGWRRGEVLSRQWRHVDLKTGVIRLEPGETKNGKGRDFPYTLIPELEALIEQQQTYTDAVEKKKGEIVLWLFHREGRPIKGFRTAWRAACKRVGLAAQAARENTTSKALWKAMSKEERRAFSGLKRIPHDFRRTAVRNLIRAGVSQKVAMELTGHLTASVFDRYNITDDRDRRDAVAKLAAAARDRQVLPLRKRAQS